MSFASTPYIEDCLLVLRPYLPENTSLISGYRTSSEQFEIIKSYANTNKIKLPEDVRLSNRESWYPVLQKLRSSGLKIAEPGKSWHEVGCTFDLTGPDLNKIYEGCKKAIADKVIKTSEIKLEKSGGQRCVHLAVSGIDKWRLYERRSAEGFEFAQV